MDTGDNAFSLAMLGYSIYSASRKEEGPETPGKETPVTVVDETEQQKKVQADRRKKLQHSVLTKDWEPPVLGGQAVLGIV